MGMRTSILVVERGIPLANFYCHWYHDSVIGIAEDLKSIGDTIHKHFWLKSIRDGEVSFEDAFDELFGDYNFDARDCFTSVSDQSRSMVAYNALSGDVCVIVNTDSSIACVATNPSIKLLECFVDKMYLAGEMV